MHGTLRERFEDKFVRGTDDECWPWTAYTDDCGYGRIAATSPDMAVFKAHRVSWEIYRGAVPVGDHCGTTCVLHRCDNPPCVNPGHLFLGTHRDNIDDMVTKGRSKKGEAQRCAKLTEPDVLSIRARYSSGGVTQRALAGEFGVHRNTVGDIVNRDTWKHVK